jgi:hypothetical protein
MCALKWNILKNPYEHKNEELEKNYLGILFLYYQYK